MVVSWKHYVGTCVIQMTVLFSKLLMQITLYLDRSFKKWNKIWKIYGKFYFPHKLWNSEFPHTDFYEKSIT